MKRPESTVVFLGPSLNLGHAREILEARYLSPARRGDIYRVMTSGVDTIVLIDGVFHNTPSVWQRELLEAIAEGIQVFGASSMGALRAAELHTLGMQGFGVVFERYRDQLIEGDDEVALLHSSEEFGYRGLSVPMVNIRYTVAQAVGEGVIAASREKELLAYVKSLPYPERTFESMLKCPSLGDAPPDEIAALKDYVRLKKVDIKMQDAIGVLRYVKALSGEPKVVIGAALSQRPASTRQQLDRVLMTRFYTAEGNFDGSELLDRVQSDTAYVELIRRQLSARRFILEWATQNGFSCPEEVQQKAQEHFAETRGIADIQAWLSANGLTYPAFITLLNEFTLVDWLASEAQTIFSLNRDDTCGDEKKDGETPLVEKAERVKAYFILDWARQNGVTIPDELRELVQEKSGDTAISTSAALHGKRRLESWESSFVEWIVKQGPSYFGIEWRFEVDLVRLLQITGQAGQVFFRAQKESQVDGRESAS